MAKKSPQIQEIEAEEISIDEAVKSLLKPKIERVENITETFVKTTSSIINMEALELVYITQLKEDMNHCVVLRFLSSREVIYKFPSLEDCNAFIEDLFETYSEFKNIYKALSCSRSYLKQSLEKHAP